MALFPNCPVESWGPSALILYVAGAAIDYNSVLQNLPDRRMEESYSPFSDLINTGNDDLQCEW